MWLECEGCLFLLDCVFKFKKFWRSIGMMIYNIIKKTPERVETSDYETTEAGGHFMCFWWHSHISLAPFPPDIDLQAPFCPQRTWPCHYPEVTLCTVSLYYRIRFSWASVLELWSVLLEAHLFIFLMYVGTKVRRVGMANRDGTECDPCQFATGRFCGKYAFTKTHSKQLGYGIFIGHMISLSNRDYWGCIVNVHNTVYHKQLQSKIC